MNDNLLTFARLAGMFPQAFPPSGWGSLPAIQPAMPQASQANSSEPPDYTDKYNTQLTPEEEQQYQAWIEQLSKKEGRDANADNFDYDMRGAWKSGVAQAANGHFPDTFKKPNHPTFSTGSQYNGVDGYQGGVWGGTDDKPTFTPGATNLANFGKSGLQAYFQRVEPGSSLLFPQPQQALPSSVAPFAAAAQAPLQ